MQFKQLLLPTPENDYTPHLLQRAAMLMMLLLIFLSFAAVNLQALLWQSSSWLVGTVLPAVVVDLTNDERKDLQAPLLQRNPKLDEAARLKAEDMAKYSYFAHYSPTGVSPWHWFDEVSYTYAHAGENLAIHFKDSGAVVKAWMNSPTHRANIVNEKYTEIGVGTAKGTYDGFETVFVVQLFGAPAAAKMVTAVDTSTALPVGESTSTLETDPILVRGENFALVSSSTEMVAGEQSDALAFSGGDKLMEDKTAIKPSEVVNEIPEVLPTMEVAEVYNEDSQTSVFSTHFATSSGLEPIAVGNISGTTAEGTHIIGNIATRPSVLLQSIYLIIGLFVAILLLSSIIIGLRHHRPWQVVYGVGLLLVMSGLFYVHAALTASVVIAAENSAVDSQIRQ